MELTRKIVSLEAAHDMKLDYNYNYELMKEIYKSIEIINQPFANQLHNTGFSVDNKRYKLFTHHLYIENPNYTQDHIEIKKGTKCNLIVSGVKEIIQNLTFGLLDKGSLNLFNNKFNVSTIENDRNVRFDKVSLYKVVNPIVATRQDENKKIIYVNPFDGDYYKILAHNLMRKYKLVYGKDYEGEIFFDIENTLAVKKKLISKIKSEFMIIGYSGFELFIEAEKDMQKVAYYCGLGGYNSLGMGSLNHIMSRRG